MAAARRGRHSVPMARGVDAAGMSLEQMWLESTVIGLRASCSRVRATACSSSVADGEALGELVGEVTQVRGGEVVATVVVAKAGAASARDVVGAPASEWPGEVALRHVAGLGGI